MSDQTTADKLRALVREMQRANERVNAAATATDYQVACIALALIARQFLRDTEAFSTLLAEAERPTVEYVEPTQAHRDSAARFRRMLRALDGRRSVGQIHLPSARARRARAQ